MASSSSFAPLKRPRTGPVEWDRHCLPTFGRYSQCGSISLRGARRASDRWGGMGGTETITGTRGVYQAEVEEKLPYRVFDADNHFYPTADAIDRYLDPKMRERALAPGETFAARERRGHPGGQARRGPRLAHRRRAPGPRGRPRRGRRHRAARAWRPTSRSPGAMLNRLNPMRDLDTWDRSQLVDRYNEMRPAFEHKDPRPGPDGLPGRPGRRGPRRWGPERLGLRTRRHRGGLRGDPGLQPVAGRRLGLRLQEPDLRPGHRSRCATSTMRWPSSSGCSTRGPSSSTSSPGRPSTAARPSTRSSTPSGPG